MAEARAREEGWWVEHQGLRFQVQDKGEFPIERGEGLDADTFRARIIDPDGLLEDFFNHKDAVVLRRDGVEEISGLAMTVEWDQDEGITLVKCRDWWHQVWERATRDEEFKSVDMSTVVRRALGLLFNVREPFSNDDNITELVDLEVASGRLQVEKEGGDFKTGTTFQATSKNLGREGATVDAVTLEATDRVGADPVEVFEDLDDNSKSDEAEQTAFYDTVLELIRLHSDPVTRTFPFDDLSQTDQLSGRAIIKDGQLKLETDALLDGEFVLGDTRKMPPVVGSKGSLFTTGLPNGGPLAASNGTELMAFLENGLDVDAMEWDDSGETWVEAELGSGANPGEDGRSNPVFITEDTFVASWPDGSGNMAATLFKFIEHAGWKVEAQAAFPPGGNLIHFRKAPGSPYVACGNFPDIAVYDTSGGGITLIDSFNSNSSDLGADFVPAVSPNGDYVCLVNIGGGTKPTEIWKWDGTQYNHLLDLPDLGNALDGGVDWSPDSNYLYVAVRGDGVLVFERDGDTFTEIFNDVFDIPSTCTASNGGGYFAVLKPNAGTRFYKNDNGTVSFLHELNNDNSGGDPTQEGFSDGGDYFVTFGHDKTRLDLYKRSGDTFGLIDSADQSFESHHATISPGASKASIGQLDSARLVTYYIDGDALVQIPKFGSEQFEDVFRPNGEAVSDVEAFHLDGATREIIIIGAGGSIKALQEQDGVFVPLDMEGLLAAPAGFRRRAVAWYDVGGTDPQRAVVAMLSDDDKTVSFKGFRKVGGVWGGYAALEVGLDDVVSATAFTDVALDFIGFTTDLGSVSREAPRLLFQGANGAGLEVKSWEFHDGEWRDSSVQQNDLEVSGLAYLAWVKHSEAGTSGRSLLKRTVGGTDSFELWTRPLIEVVSSEDVATFVNRDNLRGSFAPIREGRLDAPFIRIANKELFLDIGPRMYGFKIAGNGDVLYRTGESTYAQLPTPTNVTAGDVHTIILQWDHNDSASGNWDAEVFVGGASKGTISPWTTENRDLETLLLGYAADEGLTLADHGGHWASPLVYSGHDPAALTGEWIGSDFSDPNEHHGFEFTPTETLPGSSTIKWSHSRDDGATWTEIDAADYGSVITVNKTSKKTKLKAELTAPDGGNIPFADSMVEDRHYKYATGEVKWQSISLGNDFKPRKMRVRIIDANGDPAKALPSGTSIAIDVSPDGFTNVQTVADGQWATFDPNVIGAADWRVRFRLNTTEAHNTPEVQSFQLEAEPDGTDQVVTYHISRDGSTFHEVTPGTKFSGFGAGEDPKDQLVWRVKMENQDAGSTPHVDELTIAAETTSDLKNVRAGTITDWGVINSLKSTVELNGDLLQRVVDITGILPKRRYDPATGEVVVDWNAAGASGEVLEVDPAKVKGLRTKRSVEAQATRVVYTGGEET